METIKEGSTTSNVPIRINLELYRSIAEFQYECPIIQKSTKGYNYKYAQMSTVFEIIRPLLKKHKLGFVQLPEGDTLVTRIFHTDTLDYLEITTKLPVGYALEKMNLFQSYGASLAYYKRYVLTSALGIFSQDEDNDAQGKVAPAKKQEPIKQQLNDKQFISLIGAVNSGQYTKDWVKGNFKLSAVQVETLNSLD